MVFFSIGEVEEEEEQKLCRSKVQSLKALLSRSPTHPPLYKLKKGFNGKVLYRLSMGWGYARVPFSILCYIYKM